MTPPSPHTNSPQFPTLLEMALSLWRIKLALMVGLTLLFCFPYVYIANHPLFPARDVPLTWLDSAIPFNHHWIWVYQSVYLLTALLPLVAHTREQLRRFVTGYALLVGICFFIFIFFPTQIVRHHPAEEDVNFMFRLLWLYDGNYSALPSLHVGFLYFTLMFARRAYGPPPHWVSALLITWFLLIAYSTLALKEHYVWDLVTGVGIAVVCDMVAWSKMVRISTVTSQPG
jgi:hypothetical protein